GPGPRMVVFVHSGLLFRWGLKPREATARRPRTGSDVGGWGLETGGLEGEGFRRPGIQGGCRRPVWFVVLVGTGTGIRVPRQGAACSARHVLQVLRQIPKMLAAAFHRAVLAHHPLACGVIPE